MDKIVKLHLWGKKLSQKKIPLLPKLIKRMMRVLYSCEVPYTCRIDESVVFAHNGLGVTINASSVIGAGTVIYQNVTIGNRKGSKGPKIGKNVLIGANAVIIGDITIGDNCKIGAGALVVKDVPEGATVVSTPASVIVKDKE